MNPDEGDYFSEFHVPEEYEYRPDETCEDDEDEETK